MKYLQRCCFFFALILYTSLLASCGGGSGHSSATPDMNTISSSSSSFVASSQASSSIANTLIGCELLNFTTDTIITYKLPILFGHCALGNTTVEIDVAGKTYKLPLVSGYFKGVVALSQGANEIRLRITDQTSYSNLYYEPSQNPKKVQMVYAIASDDNGRFLAAPGEANDVGTAKKRLALEGLMMQSATAEMMNKAIRKRLTYALVEDQDGAPIIKILQLPQTHAMLLTKTGEELYSIIADELHTANEDISYKNMVTMGFSDYAQGKNLAHTALGGGSLGIFGGLHLHTCPDSIEEIIPSFSNTTRIDTSILPDDSNGRGTYWANCATGMGASLHELGHTFDHLMHTDTGIMSRDLDYFSRLFVMEEPGYGLPLTTSNERGAVWDPISVGTFLSNEWFKQ